MRYPTRRDFIRTSAAAGAALSAASPWTSIVRAADPYADAVFRAGQPPLPAKGSFTVAVLPDTQGYSMSYPDNYIAQTEWIVAQKERRNIACALHLGDITNNNTPDQWENAERAMKVLDGQLPYFMTLGNHDYGAKGHTADRTTLFHDYFPREKYSQADSFGGSYDKDPERFDNSYHFFSAGMRDFLVLSLEFGPRNDVVRWANEVVAEHKDRDVILITHAFVYYDDTRYDWAQRGPDQLWNPHSYAVAKTTNDDINDGQELWDKLVAKHDNFIMTVNGHVCADGLGRLTTATPAGREIPQVLVNFQVKPNGGDGWLRLLEFRPDGATVLAYDYSMTRDQWNVAPDNTFEMKIPA